MVGTEVITRLCKKCNTTKPLEEFHFHSYRGKRAPTHCKACQKIYQNAYSATHRKQRNKTKEEWLKKNPSKKKDYSLRTWYGITLDQYQVLLDNQYGVCAICKQPPETDKYLVVDHDHTNGTVRGLLHSNCNTALGMLQDDPIIIEGALNYLLKSKANAN